MRNHLGNKANSRLATRIADLLSRPAKLRHNFVDLLSGAMVGGGAIAFPVGLTSSAVQAPGMLLGAAACLGAGALAMLLGRGGRLSAAVVVQAAAVVLIGLIAMLAYGATLAGPLMAALAGAHVAVWQKFRTTTLHWLLLVAMAVGSTIIVMNSPHAIFGIVSGAVLFVDIAAMLFVHAARGSELTANDRALSQLLESISDGLVRLTGDGKVLHASPATENMFGCKSYSLSGSGLLERVHVLDRPAYLKAVSDTIHGGAARQAELRMRRDPAPYQNGQTRFIWTEIAFCAGPADNEQATVYGLIRDISDRKAQEQHLLDARHDAEKASNSKSVFLATMGHELRTPLNAIVGFAEMMTSGIGGTLDDTHAEYASLIGQSGRHLLDVVNMLLDMSKINAGKFELHLEEFEPDSLVEPSLHMVSAMARTSRVHIRTDVAAALPIIKGDERACRQIIINLLSNAIKFSHPDGIVSLSVRRQGAKLNITISDQGIGMSHEQVARIGEPFFQAHAGLARQYEGTGLGLSIVKGLVDLHDGTMRAASSPEEGTTITILLPLLGPEIEQEPTIVTPLHAATDAAEQTQIQPSEKQSIAS